MKKNSMKNLLLAAAVMVGSTGLAHASYIQTTFTSGTTTQIAGATVVDFNSGLPANYSGDGAVLPFSIAGMSAAPAGDATPFLSVAFPWSSGSESYVATLGQAYNYFGLYWGSIDDYNSLQFFLGNTLVGAFTGLDVLASGAAIGDQTSAGSNRFVNFFFGDLSFNRIVFSTTQYAFESDNHAFANVAVPEPTTIALMALGLFAIAWVRRRQRIT